MKAETDGVLWTIHGELYTRIICRLACEKRCRLYHLLRSVDFLQLFEQHGCVRLLDLMETKLVEEDVKIFTQGELGEGTYFIVEGKVKVEIHDVEVDQLVTKDHFGELEHCRANEGDRYCFGALCACFSPRGCVRTLPRNLIRSRFQEMA